MQEFFIHALCDLRAAGDPYMASDVVSGIKDSLSVDVAEHPQGIAPDGRALDAPWTSFNLDIVLETAL
jgi:hydroxyquinol 1,2-dioxygenase